MKRCLSLHRLEGYSGGFLHAWLLFLGVMLFCVSQGLAADPIEQLQRQLAVAGAKASKRKFKSKPQGAYGNEAL